MLAQICMLGKALGAIIVIVNTHSIEIDLQVYQKKQYDYIRRDKMAP
jgi:hypothetical protein